MSTLKTHNLQSPDSGSSNIALTPNAGMVVTGISTFSNNLDINANIDVSGTSTFAGDITANGNIAGDGSTNVTGIAGVTAATFVGSGNVGVQTSSITHSALVGAGNSFVGMYIGDGSLVFNKYLNRTGGYYISTEVNALNAGPVSLGSTMTLDGTWVIV